jgi:hypothetical protein
MTYESKEFGMIFPIRNQRLRFIKEKQNLLTIEIPKTKRSIKLKNENSSKTVYK